MMMEKSSLHVAASSDGFCSYDMPHCVLLPAWMDFVAMPCHTALLESRLQPEFTQSKSASDKETQLLGNISEHEIHIDLMSNRKVCSSEIYSVVLNINLNVVFCLLFYSLLSVCSESFPKICFIIFACTIYMNTTMLNYFWNKTDIINK